MNFQQNRKLMYKLEKNALSKQNTEEIVRQKSIKKNNPVKEKKNKEREEGFSVYLMGANEDRIKNLRKKEQLDKIMKNRSNNNSKSIKNRVKYDNKNGEKNENTNEARSKSRHREINSALIYKRIPQNENKFNEAPHNYKVSNSRDSLNNIEDMLSNINLMNKNIASNLNKLNVDSPANKRRRNDYKYGGVDFSSSIYLLKLAGREKSQNNSRLFTKQNNDLHKHDTEEKENESKTININLRDLKNKTSFKNTLEDSSSQVKLNNNKTEVVDNENIVNDNSITNELNKSINKQIINYKLSINERPISSVMNTSNYKTANEKVTSPTNLEIAKPARPFSQINVRAKERLSNRIESIKTEKTIESITKNNNISYTRKKLQNKITNYNNISAHCNMISHNTNNNSNGNFNNNFNKKNEIILRINQLDDRKISKLARLLEKLDHIDVEESNEISNELFNRSNKNELTFHKKLNPINKFSINSIQPENMNFGNVNINKNDQSLDAENSMKFSLNKFKIDLNSSMSNKINDIIINSRRESHIPEDNNFSSNLKLRESSKSLHINQQLGSPRINRSKKRVVDLDYKIISLFLISNYGNPEKIGLTEIQIFDRTNKKINIIDCKVDNGNVNGIGIIKVFNNKFHTIDENEMWSTCYSNEKISIDIYYESIYEVEYMTFWNFNGKDLSKGVKDVEIFSGNTCIFKGKISKGVYNTKTNYSTTISLNSFNFKNDKYNFEIGGKK